MTLPICLRRRRNFAFGSFWQGRNFAFGSFWQGRNFAFGSFSRIRRTNRLAFGQLATILQRFSSSLSDLSRR
jgi:hypothetical protein